MSVRNYLTNAIRFEVLTRDSYTCQYCGKKAPYVVLNIDHVVPLVNGGTDGVGNLITSCVACNNGKADRILPERLQAQVTAVKEPAEPVHLPYMERRAIAAAEVRYAGHAALAERARALLPSLPQEDADRVRFAIDQGPGSGLRQLLRDLWRQGVIA